MLKKVEISIKVFKKSEPEQRVKGTDVTDTFIPFQLQKKGRKS